MSDTQQPKYFDAFIVTERKPKEGDTGQPKEDWHRVGVAFPHREGGGMNVQITEGLAVSGKLVIRPPREREQD